METEMHIGLYIDTPVSDACVQNLYGFLLGSGLAPEGGTLHLSGALSKSPIPLHESFPLGEAEDPELDLEIAFLNDDTARNTGLTKSRHLRKLLVGHEELPQQLDHVYVPFENRRFTSRWLRSVLESAHDMGWHAHLVYCDQSFVSKEIMKLAKWFRIDAVQEAMGTWASEDAIKALGRLTADFPDIEVHAGVGNWQRTLAGASGHSVFLMGHLGSGYHLPGRHHGIHYAKLLMACGGSGFFIAD